MKTNTMKLSLRLMIVGLLLLMVSQTVTAQATGDDNEQTVEAAEKMAVGWSRLGAGLALGLVGVGAGISQGQIGAAAVGMLAEDPGRFGVAIIFTALPESLVILGLLAVLIPVF